MRARVSRAQLVADVRDALSVGIIRDVQRGSVAAQREGDDVPARLMRPDQRLQRQVGQNIAVVHEEGLRVQ